MDITARRRIEHELDQSLRFEAIGQLTAGVAHDYNNLLQGIISNLELANDDMDVAPGTREYVAVAMRLAEQGGQVSNSAVVTDETDNVSLNHFVVIRVSDTGTGIASDILAKVCEPFLVQKV